MASFRGLAGWAKMTSLGGMLKAPVCHPTKKVNKAVELNYLSTNIGGIHKTSYNNLTIILKPKLENANLNSP
jgi:hypothetical protein